MAFIVGFVTKEERAKLESRGWVVEDADTYGLVGHEDCHLMSTPPEGKEAVVVFVDSNVFEVMSGQCPIERLYFFSVDVSENEDNAG